VDQDCGDKEGFDCDLGVVDVGPFDGILGVEAVADTDESDSGEEGEEGGVGDARGELLARGEEADEDSSHTY